LVAIPRPCATIRYKLFFSALYRKLENAKDNNEEDNEEIDDDDDEGDIYHANDE
jgi:hypothetical protein